MSDSKRSSPVQRAATRSQRKARRQCAPSGVLSTTEMEEKDSGRTPVPGRDWLTVMEEGHPEQGHPLRVANDKLPDDP